MSDLLLLCIQCNLISRIRENCLKGDYLLSVAVKGHKPDPGKEFESSAHSHRESCLKNVSKTYEALT